MHPLQQQLDELRKYHEAIGTKLASLERHLEADEVLQAPTMKRHTKAISSDGSVMEEGRRYSFLYKGIAIENVLIQEVKSNSIGTDGGDYVVKYIYHVREVKEPAKEWEIVEFYSTELHRVHCKLSNRPETYYSDAVNCFFALSHMLFELKEGQVTIHAVRRLTDGTVWRVGDKVNVGTYDAIQEINQFWIETSTIMMCETTGMIVQINALRKPEPLFTTADGVQVPDGATVWFWNSCTEVEERIADSLLIPTMHYSTREAAQAAYEKWLFEQPVLTLNDLEFRGLTGQHRDELKQIVKDKIAKK